MLQAFLGFAYTIQQEFQKLRRDTAAMIESLAPENASASVQRGFPSALQRIVAGAQTLTEASGAAIGLGNEQGMVCVARSGAAAPLLGSRFNALSGLSGECIRTRESVICMNAAADPRVDYRACTALGVKSMLYLPLVTDNKLIGILAVFSSRAQHFSHRDIGSLRWTQALISESLQRNGRAQVGAGSLVPAPPLQTSEPDILVPDAAPSLASTEPLTLTAQTVAALKPEPIFLGTIVDDSVADLEPSPKLPGEADQNRLPIIIAIVIILMFLAGIGFMSVSRLASSTRRSPDVPQTQGSAPAIAAPTTTQISQPELMSATDAVKPLSTLPDTVHLKADASQVALSIDLPKVVSYEGFSINNPNRVYFDLYGVNLVSPEGVSVPVSGGLVSRIRISAFRPGITRVVFDLNSEPSFGVKVSSTTNSLSIELRQKPSSDQDAIYPRPGEVVKITSAGRTVMRATGNAPTDVSQ